MAVDRMLWAIGPLDRIIKFEAESTIEKEKSTDFDLGNVINAKSGMD